jgi:hypothetical protein
MLLTVPVISTSWPRCFSSSASLPSRRYVVAVDALPAVPAVSLAAVPLAIFAFVSSNFGPAAAAAPVVPVVPSMPALAAFETHPLIVTVLPAEADGLV